MALITTSDATAIYYQDPDSGQPVVLNPGFVGRLLTCSVIGAGLSLCFFVLTGIARSVHVLSSVAALYLNDFFVIARALRKIGLLHTLEPTRSEHPSTAALIAVFPLLSRSAFSPATI